MAVLAAPVAAWVTGAATSIGIGATAASAIGAVAGAVAIGVVSGAAIGAATALVTGGDLLDGVLKGAAIGGLTAGVTTGLSIATGLTSSADVMSSYGLAADGSKLSTDVSTSVSTGGASAAPDATKNLSQGYGSGMDASNNVAPSSSGAAAGPKATASSGFWDAAKASLSSKEAIAGGVEGAFKGLGSVAAAKMEADSAEERLEREKQIKEELIANNKPGEFEAMVAKIEVPDWWNKYLNPAFQASAKPEAPETSANNQGLLARGATA